MRLLVLTVLTWLGWGPQTAPSNLDFESGIVGQAPAAWRTNNGYKAVLVDQNCAHGRTCVLLSALSSPAPGGFGNLYEIASTRTESAGNSRVPDIIRRVTASTGRRMRFRAAIRVEGADTHVRLWFRAGGSFRNSTEITASQWNYYQVETEISPDSKELMFGVLLFGPGKAWIDDASVEEIKPRPAASPRRAPKPMWRA